MSNEHEYEFRDEIKKIITELKLIVDQLNSNFKDARELILGLARRLDEEGHYERNQICIRIKKILKGKARFRKSGLKTVCPPNTRENIRKAK